MAFLSHRGFFQRDLGAGSSVYGQGGSKDTVSLRPVSLCGDGPGAGFLMYDFFFRVFMIG